MRRDRRERRPGSLISLLDRRRTAVEWAALFLLSIAMAILLVLTRSADRADNLAYDAFSRLVTRTADPDIVLVTIDNLSLAEIGRWPWPRQVHAAVLEKIAAARPRAIIYDILFTEPSPTPDQDARLARAIAAGPPVFLPLLLQAPGAGGAAVEQTPPIPLFATARAGTGHVIAQPDDDGVLRRVTLEVRIAGGCWPHLAAVAAARLQGAEAPCGKGAASGLIPYAGPAGHYPTAPFTATLRGEIPAEMLAGKVVLVGAAASGIGDQYATPMQSRADLMSGIELNANLLDALLHGGLRQEVAQGWTLLFTLAPLVLLWAGFLYLPPRGNLLLAALLLALTLGASVWLLLDHGLWVRPAAALLVILLFLPIWGWRRLAAASRYFVTELGRLREEPGVLGPAAALPASTDRLELQMNLLRDAVRQVRDLKHFIEESHASLPDATVITGLDGWIALANARAHQFWDHYTLRRAEGALLPLFRALRPQIAQGAEDFDALATALVSGIAEEQECELALKDGGAFLLRVKPCFDPEGARISTIVRLTDITELRAAARQRDTMLQFLTHDMRSPQTSILALLAGPERDAIPTPLTRRIERHARQTLDLAEQFVQIARAEAADCPMEVVDLRDIAVEAADQLWAQAEARGAFIAVETGAEEQLVRGNASLLARAIGNLVSNAVKYGGSHARVTVTVRAEGDAMVACTVEDDGAGMTPDQVARLFQRFTRFDAGESGTGLGLVLVRTVAQRHGGSVTCASAPGKGSRFTITLPRAET